MNTIKGNEEQPDQKPLVTFALFTYNQEQFVRDAVEGAFAQTYEPLEIILSDDFSTDRTFEIMREMAAEYQGPHRIVLRQSEINLGTAAHVQAVANKMTGELLIVAAGDDISMPERASLTVDAWLAGGKRASVLHGKMIEIDALTKCEISHKNFRRGGDVELNLDWFVRHKRLPFWAPTCAYAKSIFANYQPLIGGSIIEDQVLVLRCFIEGIVTPISHFLVQQRVGYISSSQGFNYKNPLNWNRSVRSKTIVALNLLQDIVLRDGIEKKSQKILEKYCLKQVRFWPKLVLPLGYELGFASRVLMGSRVIFLNPESATFLGKVWTAIRLFDLMPSKFIKMKAKFERGALAKQQKLS